MGAAAISGPARAVEFPSVAPERSAVKADKMMVSAANPHAARAGLDVLKAGGNAVDAALAVQLVLTLAEPQSSGIGGGGFLLYYDAQTQTVTAYDGRETAPAAATPDLFLDGDGAPLKFFDAVMGGKSVGAKMHNTIEMNGHGGNAMFGMPTENTGFATMPRSAVASDYLYARGDASGPFTS
ncbi:MAG: gamma-glutamyltransferase, partial [Rhodospirillales bacterium]|nr:gamma-glutamyltransferase [Rhodospirillales bacterium]